MDRSVVVKPTPSIASKTMTMAIAVATFHDPEIGNLGSDAAVREVAAETGKLPAPGVWSPIAASPEIGACAPLRKPAALTRSETAACHALHVNCRRGPYGT